MKTKLQLLTLDERTLPSTSHLELVVPSLYVQRNTPVNAVAQGSDVAEIRRMLRESSPVIAAMLDSFDEANGEIVIAGKGEKRPGGFFPTGEEGGNHPIIRIAPDAKGVNGIPAITFAVTLFELIRASNAHEQAELDQQVKDGKLTTKQYADASERLTAKYIAEHRRIVKDAIASGQLPAEADIFKAYDGLTEDQILDRMKDSGHWRNVKDRGQFLYDAAHPSVIPLSPPA